MHRSCPRASATSSPAGSSRPTAFSSTSVVGGDGPALLLVHGWPESWYAWRFVMPALANDFSVVAVDQRGMGLSDKPEDGYDAGTLANDLAGLMTSSATSGSRWPAMTPAWSSATRWPRTIPNAWSA